MKQIFHERATAYSDVRTDHCYIDAFCLNLIRKPWEYDVCPMENQFGDITSELGAGLICGMGYAPSADLGDKHGLFQPSHGSAPDIAGLGIANPTAPILSAAMMLDWLGEKHGVECLIEAARNLEDSVDKAFVDKTLLPFDIGGKDGTSEVTRSVIGALG